MGIFSGFFKPVPVEPLTRLFFASDLHGSERTFRKFLAAARHYNAGVLLMGGDVVGKVAVPIIKEAGGRYRVRLMGRTERIPEEAALPGLMERLGTLGYYGKVLEEEEFHQISADPAKTESLFRELAAARLQSWIWLAEERLKGSGIRLYMMGGNDDEQETLDSVAWEGCESVVYCEGKAVEIDAHHVMVSDGHSNLTPWNTPRELPEEQLNPLLEFLARLVPDPSRAIFNFHVPPVDFDLGYLPAAGLDDGPALPNHQGRAAGPARSGQPVGP